MRHSVAAIVLLAVGSLTSCGGDSHQQASAPPSRFVDNRDGTVTDNSTGLTWEKKTGTLHTGANLLDCSTVCTLGTCEALPCYDPDDVNNAYSWSAGGAAPDGSVFTVFLAELNGMLCRAGTTCTSLAGHSDWRLPTISELQTILDQSGPYCQNGNPCINSIFGPAAIASGYWSSSTNAFGADYAWGVGFAVGDVGSSLKSSLASVRAVRGGS